jgi:hypothetical protein
VKKYDVPGNDVHILERSFFVKNNTGVITARQHTQHFYLLSIIMADVK